MDSEARFVDDDPITEEEMASVRISLSQLEHGEFLEVRAGSVDDELQMILDSWKERQKETSRKEGRGDNRECDDSTSSIKGPTHSLVISGMIGTLPSIADTGIRDQVVGFCEALDRGLADSEHGIDANPMYSDILDDEAYYEWIFDDFRFGFSFRHDPSDSYWFLVSRDPAEGSVRSEGDFSTGYPTVVGRVLSHIESRV